MLFAVQMEDAIQTAVAARTEAELSAELLAVARRRVDELEEVRAGPCGVERGVKWGVGGGGDGCSWRPKSVFTPWCSCVCRGRSADSWPCLCCNWGGQLVCAWREGREGEERRGGERREGEERG
jgi:hypothetical protein